jgi:hypothetical protein
MPWEGKAESEPTILIKVLFTLIGIEACGTVAAQALL